MMVATGAEPQEAPKMGPRGSKMFQDGPKMPSIWLQDVARCSQDGPKMFQEAAKMGKVCNAFTQA